MGSDSSEPHDPAAKVRLLRWAPRIMSLLFVAFLSLFALDVFDGATGWQVVLAFLIHLVPSFVLIAVIAVAWRYEFVGAVAFGAFVAWYVWTVGPDRPWSWYAGIAGPAALVAILYALSWYVGRRSGAD